LDGREKFQGIPPWERSTELRRNGNGQNSMNLARQGPQKGKEVEISKTLSPMDLFRRAHTTSAEGMGENVSDEERKERVIWRFEDVSWVKQRTVRPRKRSYVGTFDQRVRIESGVQRYGPYGIGGGVIEGVGGVRNIIERGLDGEIRCKAPEKEKVRRRQEIVV
jgi:hypothetical protein